MTFKEVLTQVIDWLQQERIGSINGIFTPPPRQRPPPAAPLTPGSCLPPSAPRPPAGAAAARRSAVQRDCGWCWTGVSGWGRVAPQGCPGGTASGRATEDGWRGPISNGIATAQRGETSLRCAHVAPESTRDGMGLLGDAILMMKAKRVRTSPPTLTRKEMKL